jgi:hypothetical protein
MQFGHESILHHKGTKITQSNESKWGIPTKTKMLYGAFTAPSRRSLAQARSLRGA